MNISTILDMLRDDSKVLDDPSAFMKRVNEQNVTQMVTGPVVVQEAMTRITSIAEMNGGVCTQEDIDAALALVAKKPLIDKAEVVKAQIDAAISSGEVTDVATLAAKLTAVAADVVKPDANPDVPADVDPIVVGP